MTRTLRPTRWFYRSTWTMWRRVGLGIRTVPRRETYLGYYGPLSLILLLTAWATTLVIGFAMLQWGVGSRLAVHTGAVTFADQIYLSGTTFFTLGLGDVTPLGPLARGITVVEAGTGFGFLALVIGYFPVLYSAFSRREVAIVLLDARAGSPPTAAELLCRQAHDPAALVALLAEWERWCAELLESHLSYPVLSYFRSQHDNQSWLAALTTILDATVLLALGVAGENAGQARLTFAIARHAVVDLAQVLGIPPRVPARDRLPADHLRDLREHLARCGLTLPGDRRSLRRLARLRRLYEPYVVALGERLLLPVPTWTPAPATVDNWRTSAWETPTSAARPPRRTPSASDVGWGRR